jgi:hypothetical protein
MLFVDVPIFMTAARNSTYIKTQTSQPATIAPAYAGLPKIHKTDATTKAPGVENTARAPLDTPDISLLLSDISLILASMDRRDGPIASFDKVFI